MAALLPSMRIRFSNAGSRGGNSAGGAAATGAAGSAGAAGRCAASRLASRSCSSTTSLRNSPSDVKGRRSMTRNDSSCFFSDKGHSSTVYFDFSLSRVAPRGRSRTRAGASGEPRACQRPNVTVECNAWRKREIFRNMTPPGKRQTKNGKNSRRRQTKPVKRTQAAPGKWFERLVAVQARLRAPDGCPWDREQTHESLRTYLIEEAYEVLEAMESRNDAKFAEEMGDLLLQIVFHSQIAQERGGFTISDVIRESHDKMIQPHPHVFGETHAKDSAEVLRNWEQIKAEERLSKAENPGKRSGSKGPEEASLLDGVSRALPATLEGFQLTRKAARIGFDWETAGGIFEK